MDTSQEHSNELNNFIDYEEIDDEDLDENFVISRDDLYNQRHDEAEDVGDSFDLEDAPKKKKVM